MSSVCIKCNEPLEPTWDECPACETPIEKEAKCVQCGEALKPHWQSCPACKTAVANEFKCAICGEEVKPHWKSCPECNRPLHKEPTDDEVEAEVSLNQQDNSLQENPSDSYNIVISDIGKMKLVLVKLVSEITNMRLSESKELVDSAPFLLKIESDYNNAMLIKNKILKVGAECAITTKELLYEVILIEHGNFKLECVKWISKEFGYKLGKAKEITDTLPQVLFSGIPYSKAMLKIEEISSFGGKCQLKIFS